MKPTYIIERWPYGWVLCGPSAMAAGIPADALKECMPLFGKNDGIDAGITHHLRQSGRTTAVMCIVSPANGRHWRREITESLAGLPPQERWWKGVDVGKSSAAMFAALCDSRWFYAADNFGESCTPQDAGDFGRCKRLLDAIPEWRPLLSKVAEKYPETKWPAIIARWAELEAATPETQTQILRNL